jgi:hypothetical protein
MKTRNRIKHSLAGAAMAALTNASASAALTVNVNFDYTVTTRTDLVGPAGGTGETWNQAMGGTHAAAGGFYSNSTVLDSAGAATGVTWSLQRSDGGALYRWVGSESATFSMLQHGIFTNSNLTHTLTITGLDSGKTYDFYLTSYNTGFGASSASHTTANATTTAIPQVLTNDAAGANSGTWVLNENYIVFEDMEPDITGTITINAAKSTSYAFWSGFQVVEVPEPSAVLLGAMGAMGLGLRRRRN